MPKCSCGCRREVTFNKKKKIWNIYLKGHYNKTDQFNRNIFKSICTEKDAYWLGYFFADGYVRDRGYFGFHISLKDKDHLDAFLLYIESSHKPKIYRNDYYRVEISDKDYCDNVLRPLGLVQGKSEYISFPQIRSNLYRHFIRGVFDGDGWICARGTRSTFGIIGNNKLIPTIQNKLILACELNKTKLHIDKRCKGKWIRTLQYGGNKNLLRIFSYLYKNTTVYLKRKLKIWKKIFPSYQI